jgi:hypothetical protein
MQWTNHKAAWSLMYNGVQRLFTISYNVGFKPTQQERESISNLVGAAPALLQALENLVAVVDMRPDAYPLQDARAAIARARARGITEEDESERSRR